MIKRKFYEKDENFDYEDDIIMVYKKCRDCGLYPECVEEHFDEEELILNVKSCKNYVGMIKGE